MTAPKSEVSVPSGHEWLPGGYGHGTMHCKWCSCTDREAALALGNECPSAPLAAAPRPTGEAVAWQAKMIDGQWRVGLRGNLDTVHDATITVHKHGEGDIDRHIAEWVADAHNADLAAPPAQSADSGGELWEIGSWLSAALDDPKVCDEMKAAITSWFEGGGYLRQALAQPAPQDDFSPFSLKGEDTQPAMEGAVVGDWSEFEDDLSDAIGDSIDMDWNSGDGAKAVVRWLNENAPRKPDRPRR